MAARGAVLARDALRWEPSAVGLTAQVLPRDGGVDAEKRGDDADGGEIGAKRERGGARVDPRRGVL